MIWSQHEQTITRKRGNTLYTFHVVFIPRSRLKRMQEIIALKPILSALIKHRTPGQSLAFSSSTNLTSKFFYQHSIVLVPMVVLTKKISYRKNSVIVIVIVVSIVSVIVVILLVVGFVLPFPFVFVLIVAIFVVVISISFFFVVVTAIVVVVVAVFVIT